jgi:cullin 3
VSLPEQFYQDRVHTASENVPEITIAGLHLFLDNVLHSKDLPVREHVISALLGQVQVERDGHSINRSAMKECVEVYTTLINPRNGVKVYYEDLEPSFLNESQRFYAVEAQKLLETCDAPEYLRRASLFGIPFTNKLLIDRVID